MQPLEVGGQGQLFPETSSVAAADDQDDEFAEPSAHAEIVGVDSARAARGARRRTHSYPKPKYAGGATGAVLGEVFGTDGDAA